MCIAVMKHRQLSGRRLRVTREAAAWCSLLLLLLLDSHAVSQINPVVVPVPQPYLDVIEQYRRGDFEPAIVLLRSWAEPKTLKCVRALMSRQTPAGQVSDVPAMFAAVMLHTEAAFAAVEGQHPSEGSFHLRLAADLLHWMTLKVPDERQWLFTRRDWRLMVARVLNFYFAWDVHESLITAHPRTPDEVIELRAMDVVESDADMELAFGSLAEGFAEMIARSLEFDGRIMQSKQAALVRRCTLRAEGHFRRAKELRPDMCEAHLRLGRVLMDQGRTAEAQVELRGLLKEATDPRIVHLALLFLGDAAEKGHRVDEAADSYRRAVEIKPGCQAGLIALAYATERGGRVDMARSVLAPFLGRSDARTVPADDWTSYPRGQFQAGFDALDRLGASVARR